MKKNKCFYRITAVAASAALAAGMAIPASAAAGTKSADAELYAAAVREGSATAAAGTYAAYVAVCDAFNADPSATPAPASEPVDFDLKGKIVLQPGEAIGNMLGIKPGTKIGVGYDINAYGDDVSATADLRVNSKKIVDAAFYGVGENIYLGFPTLSSGWLTLSEKEAEALASEYAQNTVPAAGSASMNLESLEFFKGDALTEESTARIFNTYTEIYLKYCNDVTIKNDVGVSACGISDKYQMIRVSFTGDDIYNMSLDAVNALAKDKDIMKVWTSLGRTSEEYTTTLKGLKKDITSSKEEFKNLNLDVDIYLDKDGMFVGEQVVVKDSGNIVSDTYAMSAVSGNKFGVDVYSKSEGFDYKYKLKGNVENSGVMNINGQVSIKAKGDSASNDIDQSYKFVYKGDDSKGTFKMNGVVSDSDKFTLNAKYTQNNAKARFVYFTNNQKLFTLDCTAQLSNGKPVSAPNGKTYKLSVEKDVEEYFNTLNFKKLAANIESVRGDLGDMVTNMVLSYLTGQG